MAEKLPVIKYYSVIKKNEIITYTGKYMELEIIILNEVTQVQKTHGLSLLTVDTT